MTPPPGTRLRTVGRVAVDALTYAVVLTAVTALVALTLGITTGGGFVRGKNLLFVFGWVMMAYATAKLWVKSGKQLRGHAENEGAGQGDGPGEESRPPDPMAESSALRSRVTNDPSGRNVYGESLRKRQDATRFQAFVGRLPPNRWVRPPRPERRMTVAGKVFIASVFVLALSFVMEVVFGVT